MRERVLNLVAVQVHQVPGRVRHGIAVVRDVRSARTELRRDVAVTEQALEKGDHVSEGQVLVRLEDDEYQAQLLQATGQLTNLQAKLDEAMHGSRPEEIAQAQANLSSAKADLFSRTEFLAS